MSASHVGGPFFPSIIPPNPPDPTPSLLLLDQQLQNPPDPDIIPYSQLNVYNRSGYICPIVTLSSNLGHIWRTGFQNNDLQGDVFGDVPEALRKWHASGIKIYIYSSGSREAQRLLFGNTKYGDLRKYLCGFFDTTIGNKREAKSYFEISQSLGVDKPSQILFVTDVYQEAVAAKSSGLEVQISIRPGNAPLPENHGFKTISSFEEI